MDPRHPVHATTGIVDLLDLLGQPRIRERPIRRRATLPVMKASPADAQHAAHHSDGIVRLLRGDQRVRLAYRPSSSLAKKTAAFRKISRSIRSFAFSSRSRASSSRSSPESPPGRSPRSAFSSFSQLRSVTSEIPNDLASLRCGWSPSRARRIASRRNSSGYGGRGSGHLHLTFPGLEPEAFKCRRNRGKSTVVHGRCRSSGEAVLCGRSHPRIAILARSSTDSRGAPGFCVHARGRLLAIVRAASTARSRACASSPTRSPAPAMPDEWSCHQGSPHSSGSDERKGDAALHW